MVISPAEGGGDNRKILIEFVNNLRGPFQGLFFIWRTDGSR